MVNFGDIEHHGRARRRRQDEHACLKGLRQGQKIHRRIAEKRENNEFHYYGSVDDGASKQFGKTDRRQSYAQNYHAHRRGHVSQQPDGVYERLGKKRPRINCGQRNAYRKAYGVGIKYTLKNVDVSLVTGDAKHAGGKYQYVKRKARHTRKSHELGIIWKQSFYYRHSKKTYVSHHRRHGKDSVLRVVVLFSKYKVYDKHKQQLQRQRYDKKQAHVRSKFSGKRQLQKGAYYHTGRTQIHKYCRDGGKVFFAYFSPFAQSESGQYVAQRYKHVCKSNGKHNIIMISHNAGRCQWFVFVRRFFLRILSGATPVCMPQKKLSASIGGKRE